MRWKPGQRRSRNLEDRRAQTGGRGTRRGGFPFPFPMGRSGGGGGGGGGMRARPKLSLGSIVIMLVLFFLFRGNLFGGAGAPGGGGLPDGFQIPQLPDVAAPQFPNLGAPQFPGAGMTPGGQAASPDEERMVDFISFVLDDVQATWGELYPNYRDAKLVLFRDAVRSGCGFAAAQMGPFYCPADEKVYIDLDFYDELQQRFGAPGDFAQAYVLAHEIGHHLQKVSGIEPQVRQAQKANPRAANQLSVRMELQADCLAGVWAAAAGRKGILESGDIEEGLNAAAAIGDDRIQRKTTGRVHPEGFTHGSSEQRVEWLQKGIEAGSPNACDTF
jgi:predicted metalloprotease